MKLAVVSDIHGNLAALDAVLDDIAREGVDATLNLGDILSGPLQPCETADRLMALDWPTIAGNHERQLLRLRDRHGQNLRPDTGDGYAALQLRPDQIDWLRALPPTRVFADEVLMVHGTPHSDLTYWLETVTPDAGTHGSPGIRPATVHEVTERRGDLPGWDTFTLALCGHSHTPRAVQVGPCLLVNPGSVGQPGFDDDHGHRHVVHTGAPHARYALLERRGAGWQVALKAVPYAAAPQARLAAERGFPAWATALSGGWMETSA